MPRYASFVDCHRGGPLRSAEARRHKPRSRRLKILVAHLGNGYRESGFGLLPLRVAPLRCRAVNFLRPLPCLLDRVRPKGADLYSPRCAPHPYLRNENLLAGWINAQPETGRAAAPDEVFGLCGPRGIDRALCQASHATLPNQRPEAYRKQPEAL